MIICVSDNSKIVHISVISIVVEIMLFALD